MSEARRAVAGLVLLVVMVLGPGSTRAQPQPAPAPEPAAEPRTPEELARVHFQTATALFAAGDLEFALTEFQAAYEAKPHPTVLRNIAATQEQLHRYPDAAQTLEHYLREATAASMRAERAAVEEHLVGLRSLIGRVQVVLPEPGFAIEIDGRSVGTSPLEEPVDVSLGPRTIAARRDGWEPVTVLVRVQPGTTARAELHPVARMARLTVDSAAPHATVSVDGAEALPAPWENAVMPGRHRIRVTAPGRRPAVLRADLEPGAERSMVVQLETGGPQGMVAVEVTPPTGARVTVDGLPFDLGHRAARTVEQGLHRVVADAPDRASYETNVRVRTNRITHVRVHLDKDRFWVSPLWGTIATGGALIALASAVWNGLRASSAANDYRDPSTPTQDLGRLYRDRERFARAADVAGVTTLIIGAGAALLFYWAQQRPSSSGHFTIDAIE